MIGKPRAASDHSHRLHSPNSCRCGTGTSTRRSTCCASCCGSSGAPCKTDPQTLSSGQLRGGRRRQRRQAPGPRPRLRQPRPGQLGKAGPTAQAPSVGPHPALTQGGRQPRPSGVVAVVVVAVDGGVGGGLGRGARPARRAPLCWTPLARHLGRQALPSCG